MADDETEFECPGCGKRTKLTASGRSQPAICVKCALRLLAPPVDDVPEAIPSDLPNGWRGMVQAARSQVDTKLQAICPHVRQLFHDRIGPLAAKVATNDKALRLLCQQVYRMLPIKIRTLVSEAYFCDFCVTNRNRLFGTNSEIKGSDDSPRVNDSSR